MVKIFFLSSELKTLYTLTSVCIFSLQLSKHFLRCWKGDFAQQSRASTVGDYLFYPYDLNVWFTGDIVGENLMLITNEG